MKKWFPAKGLAVSLLMAALLAALVQSTSAAPPDGETQTLKGAVERFNHSPKGEYDALLMKSDGKLVQINFPPHMAAEIAKALAVGDQISVVAASKESKGDHPVYELQKVTTAKGTEIVLPEPKPRAKPEPKPHAKPKAKPVETIEGVVKYLSYARRGEVNGAVLASGDFVHLGPHGAEMLKLSVGQKLKAEGEAAPMADGHKVIEHPMKVNDMEIPGGRRPEKSPPKPPRQEKGPRAEKKHSQEKDAP